jgi:tetratricopeptide (TPR) repeat protein
MSHDEDGLPEALRRGLVLDDGEGPAAPLSPEAAELMLARARAEVGVVSMVGRGLGKGVILGLAAAVTLAAAAAGTWAWTARTQASDVVADAARSGVEPAAPAPVVVHDEAEVDDAVEPPRGAVPEQPAGDEVALGTLPSLSEAYGEDEPEATPAPSPAHARRRAQSERGAEPSAQRAARRRAAERRVSPAPSSVEPPRSRAPADLLAEANSLRGQRRWADAERAYLRVIDEYPSDSAAYVARAAAGALRLERLGDARGALLLLQDARRDDPHGPLDPELRLGIAEAYTALGREDVAHRELVDLADTYPTSAQATVARRRLGAR